MGPLKNTKHEAFTLGIFNGKGQQEAYLDAGYKCTPAAASVAAHRLLTDPNIQARLDTLKGKVADRAVITKTWLEQKVQDLAQKAEDKDQLNVAKGCYELLGRDKGVFTERRNITVRSLEMMTEDEITNELARLEAGDTGSSEGGSTGRVGKASAGKRSTRGSGSLLN